MELRSLGDGCLWMEEKAGHQRAEVMRGAVTELGRCTNLISYKAVAFSLFISRLTHGFLIRCLCTAESYAWR